MTYLLYLLRDILQLRRGPEDMPYSPALLVAVCVTILVLQVIASSALDLPGQPMLVGLIGMVINLGFLYAAVSLRGFGSRFVQTATTLFCCAVIFSIVLLPIDIVFIKDPPAVDQMSPLHLLLALVALPIFGWKLIVDAHIFRQSLGIPFLAGMGVAILWITIAYGIAAALSPNSPAS